MHSWVIVELLSLAYLRRRHLLRDIVIGLVVYMDTARLNNHLTMALADLKVSTLIKFFSFLALRYVRLDIKVLNMETATHWLCLELLASSVDCPWCGSTYFVYLQVYLT